MLKKGDKEMKNSQEANDDCHGIENEQYNEEIPRHLRQALIESVVEKMGLTLNKIDQILIEVDDDDLEI